MLDWSDYDIGKIIVCFIFAIIVPICLIVGWVYAFDNIEQTDALYKAMDGCIKCECQEGSDYYMFTCDNESFKINEQQYLHIKYNLNVSECK